MKGKQMHLPVWVLLCNNRNTPYAVSQTRGEAEFFRKAATKISKKCQHKECKKLKWRVVKGCVKYTG